MADYEYTKEFINIRLGAINENLFNENIVQNAGKLVFDPIKMKMWIMRFQVRITYLFEGQEVANMTLQSQDQHLLYKITRAVIRKSGDLIEYNKPLEFINAKIDDDEDEESSDVFGNHF